MKRTTTIFLSTIAVAVSAFLLISWRQKASNLAARFIDIQEIGDNEGFSNKVFEKMMKEVGWKGGEAWCMYFAKSIYLQAFPNKAAAINKVLTGSTQQSWKNAIANPDLFKIITSGRPQKGDIIIWKSTANSSQGHAGIVLKKDSGDIYIDVEGNSSLSGGREGSGVTKHTRLLVPGTVEGSLKLLGFLRLKTNLF